LATKIVVLFKVKYRTMEVMMSGGFELLEEIRKKLVGRVRFEKVDQILNLHDVIIEISARLKVELSDLSLDA